MRRKAVWQLSVTTTKVAVEPVASLLESILRQSPVCYHDLKTGRMTVSVYSERPPAWTESHRASFRASITELRLNEIQPGPCRVIVRRLPPADWAESWKEHFRPIQIGRALLVKPSWISQKPLPGQAEIILDPGLSFGTGNHPTTLFCLQRLAAHRPRQNKRPQSFVDMGTGSGILAIAAAKLGYQPVHAFDFDPDAVRTARANARLNKTGQQIRVSRADVTELSMEAAPRADLVCANLLTTLLLSERRRIARRVALGGTLVLAGILTREFPDVRSAYEPLNFRLVKSSARGPWTSGEFHRKR